MLQADEPDDYVIATGEEHSVREFAEIAFEHVGLDWSSTSSIDPEFLRPPRSTTSSATRPRRARSSAGSRASRSGSSSSMMVDADLERLSNAAAMGVT